jgi:ubiquinone/menaquinone biosynthesis C-methylase UbiE
MKSTFKQTWWDNNLDKRFSEFESWIGSSTAPSKVWARNYVKEKGYITLVDLGCGTATEYFAYQEQYPQLKYLGVDSSEFLYNRNVKLGVPMVLAPIEDTKLPKEMFDVAFSRHILEHQPDFRLCLDEMIRIATKEAIHIFFISPGDKPEHIGYDSKENLYHNRYNKKDIEDFVKSRWPNTKIEWFEISGGETALIIKK